MKPAKGAGYSGTPLTKKLVIKSHATVVTVNAPRNYRRLLDPLPASVVFSENVDRATDIVHVFCTKGADLSAALADYCTRLDTRAVVWVSWPKKTSRVVTDVTEDVIREIALPLGFVDIKVCAIDEKWSAIKLVVRKELR